MPHVMERAPRSPLDAFVKAIVVRDGAEPREHVLWPDADIEIVFGVPSPRSAISIEARRLASAGLQWTPIRVRTPREMTLSVRLFPWGLLRLRDASTAHDAAVAKHLVADILDRLAAQDRVGALEAAEAWLLALHAPPRIDAGLSTALRRVYEAPESAPLVELCDLARCSARELQRRTRDAIGCTPKQLQRLARFHQASLALATRPRTDLADLAFALGYADQAHLSREFRSFAQMPPARFRRLFSR